MSGKEDTLRLVAEVVDKFTGPQRQMTKALHEFQDMLKGGHAEGSKAAKEHANRHRELREQVEKTHRFFETSFGPALETLGIEFLGVGGSIAAVTEKLKDAAENFKVFRDASIRSHATVDSIQAISRAISDLAGGTTDEAVQSFADFNEQLDRLSRGRPDTVNNFRSLYSGPQMIELQSLLKGKHGREALDALMDWKDAHPEIAIDKVRDIMRLLHINTHMATVSAKELHEEERMQDEWQRAHPYNAEVAERLDKAFIKLRLSLDGLGTEIVNEFGGAGARAIESMATLIEGISKDIKDFDDWWEGRAKQGNNWTTGTDRRTGKDVPAGLNPKIKEFFSSPGSPADDLSKAFKEKSDARKNFMSGFHPTAFITGGGSSSDSENILARGVKSGMLGAFREWYASVQAPSGGGGAGGVKNASLGNLSRGGDGADNSPIGRAVAAANAAKGMRRADVGGGVAGAGAGAGGEETAPDDGGPIGQAGSGINRDKWLAQLEANPRLKDELYRRSLGENSDPMANQAVMEEAANRADIRGNKNFSDHSNLSYFQGHWNKPITQKMRVMLDANYDKVFRQGSDVSYGAIDNSSQGLAWTHEHGGQMGGYGRPGLLPGRFRTTTNYGGDRITGHRGVESFEAPGWGESGKGERDRYPAWRHHQLAEAAQRAANGGNTRHTVEGNASLGINLNGFPKGTTTDLTYGGLFKQYTLQRGQQMEAADQK